jgi:hypothetical protein
MCRLGHICKAQLSGPSHHGLAAHPRNRGMLPMAWGGGSRPIAGDQWPEDVGNWGLGLRSEEGNLIWSNVDNEVGAGVGSCLKLRSTTRLAQEYGDLMALDLAPRQ